METALKGGHLAAMDAFILFFYSMLLFCLYVLEGRTKKKEFQDAEEKKCFWKKESKKYYRGLSLFTPIQLLCIGKLGM